MSRRRMETTRPGASLIRRVLAIAALSAGAAGALVAGAIVPTSASVDTQPAATVESIPVTSRSSAVRTDDESLDGAPAQGRTVVTVLAESPVHRGGDRSFPVVGSVAEGVNVAAYGAHADRTRIWFRGDFAWTATKNLDVPRKAASGARPSVPSSTPSSAPSSTAETGDQEPSARLPEPDPTSSGPVAATPPAPNPTPSVPAVPDATADGAPGTFTVTGSGWGHGVGMSQYGAAAMARNGYAHGQILAHYYRGAELTSTAEDGDIRVHLLDTASTTVTASTKLRIAGLDGEGRSATLEAVGGAVRARIDGVDQELTRERIVLEWPGTRHWEGPASTVSVPGADNGSGPVALRHGRLEVSAQGGQLNVITALRVDDEYLYGLAEVPSSWPREVLAAQAVAARTYALVNMDGVDPGCDCHVTDETSSQKFTGFNHEGGDTGENWTATVDATSGRILTHAGTPINAVYHSSSGGHTRSSEDVWGGAEPYLTAAADPWSLHADAANPHAAWTRQVSQQDMREVFGTDRAVVSVSLVQGPDTTVSRAVARLDDGATATVTGKAFRSGVGAKSAWIRSVAGS